MSTVPLQLNSPPAAFAAGREIAVRSPIAFRATFKLFVWMCLHADAVEDLAATPAELARAPARTKAMSRWPSKSSSAKVSVRLSPNASSRFAIASGPINARAMPLPAQTPEAMWRK